MAEKKTGTHGREALAKILARTPEKEGAVVVAPVNIDPPKVFDGVTVQEVAEVQEAMNRPTEVAVATMHGYAPDNMEKSEPAGADVEVALVTIQDAIERGFKFTDAQKDVGINMSLGCLPESEREWFLEICEKIHVIPRWQGLWGQFRRCHEWGMANAPVLDPGWEIGEMGPLESRECEWCHATYTPVDRKQDVCSNRCGGQKELARLGIKPEVKSVPIEEGEPEYLEDLEKEAKTELASAIPDLPLLPAVGEVAPEV